MLFRQYKCPQCGEPWYGESTKHECGYEQKILVCPMCLRISLPLDKNIYMLLANRKRKTRYGCKCSCTYIQPDISMIEYDQMSKKIYNSLPDSDGLPYDYDSFISDLFLFLDRKYVYDHLPNKSQIDHSHPDVIEFFAFLEPESEESKQYFMEKYGKPYEELLATIQDKDKLEQLRQNKLQEDIEYEAKKAARQEDLHPTPKCPICGSTNLSKISALTKAAKISAFGIYGAGDIGKTYKCDNCGARF